MAEEEITDGQNDIDSASEESQTDVTTNETTEDVTTESNTESESEDGGDSEGAEIPESYEFDMPEGMELDQGLADAVTPIFKDLNLNQEQAGKLTAVFAAQKQQEEQAAEEAFGDQMNQWAGEIRNDKDLGGEAFERF